MIYFLKNYYTGAFPLKGYNFLFFKVKEVLTWALKTGRSKRGAFPLLERPVFKVEEVLPWTLDFGAIFENDLTVT